MAFFDVEHLCFIGSTILKKKIYHTVIEEVIMNVRETFLDEGCDEQLLQELKQVYSAATCIATRSC